MIDLLKLKKEVAEGVNVTLGSTQYETFVIFENGLDRCSDFITGIKGECIKYTKQSTNEDVLKDLKSSAPWYLKY